MGKETWGLQNAGLHAFYTNVCLWEGRQFTGDLNGIPNQWRWSLLVRMNRNGNTVSKREDPTVTVDRIAKHYGNTQGWLWVECAGLAEAQCTVIFQDRSNFREEEECYIRQNIGHPMKCESLTNSRGYFVCSQILSGTILTLKPTSEFMTSDFCVFGR